MANLFTSIRVRPPKSHRFNLSHSHKLTGKFGKLIPIMCIPTLPGDIFKNQSEVLVRLAPMLAPIMTKCTVYSHFFFVPSRLLWDKFKEFITGGEDGKQSPEYPRIKISHGLGGGDLNYRHFLYGSGSLADYLGFPTPLTTEEGEQWIHPSRELIIDALPFRAYQLIYNEYYRDQNLQESVDIMKSSSGITEATGRDSEPQSHLLRLRNRAWQKDYFTSALPFAQRGDDVRIPLHGKADLLYSDFTKNEQLPSTASLNVVSTPSGHQDGILKSSSSGNLYLEGSSQREDAYITGDGLRVNLNSGILSKLIEGVDLSTASSATINELRRAIKAQEFLELAARGGSRYIEQIYSYFGVRSSDARLQRPEFLGGGKSPIMISDVLQTSQSTETSAQANPSGHGVSVQNSHSFKFRCEEHGYIIGILSVMPKAAYLQGMPRVFQKFDRLDYYWPQFAHLGEQEIKNSEIYSSYMFPEDTDDGTFGYTPRYAEYKTMMDSVHGDFRNSLSFWHMARIFKNVPGLNEEFITNVEDAANRVFNVMNDDVDKIWCNVHHNLIAMRKMPKYGTPMF